MGSDSLFWGDGLFLKPQHFQVVESNFQHKLSIGETWATPYYYGINRLLINQDALSNWRISLPECELRLKDGTILRIPQDAHLSPVDIPRDVFETADSRVKVYVGIHELVKGSNNLSEQRDGALRYVQHREPVEDENAEGNREEITFRKLNPKLLVGEDAAQGYDAIPVMQLRLGATAEAPPQLDEDFIPPLLTKDAWPQLQNFVRSVYDQLGASAQKFAAQMIDRGVSFGSGHKEDLERILHLHAINTSLGNLSYFPFTPGIHPFSVYQELCRAVAALAIFRRERRISELPYYDHDDMAPCFQRLKQMLAIETDQAADYVRVPFVSEGLQMTVRLQSDWLSPNWAFFIGVEANITTARVTEILSERELTMKVGATEEVDKIYTRGRRGVQIIPVGDAPRMFPRKNWHYFRVNREGAFESVERSLNLGIRFNERRVEQQIAGENKIEVPERENGTLVTLAFSLFSIQNSNF